MANRGSKQIYPLKTSFLDDSRGVSGKIFESDILGKIDYYCIFRPLFSNIFPKFSKIAPSGQKMGKTTPPYEEMLGKQTTPLTLRFLTETEKGRKIVREPLVCISQNDDSYSHIFLVFIWFWVIFFCMAEYR